MRNIIKTAALLTILILCSCKDNSTNPNTGGLTGNMIGYVNFQDSLYNTWANGQITGNLADATVSLEGTSFQTTTDSIGKWILKDIPAGIYNIAFSKKGFNTRKSISHQFVGNGTDYVGSVTLNQTAVVHASFVLRPFEDYELADSTVIQNGRAIFTGKNDDIPNYAEVIVMSMFFGRTNHIDPNDPNSYLYQTSFYQPNGSDLTTGWYDLSDIPVYKNSLYTAGFKSNDSVYCTIYAVTYQSQYDYYFDVNSGKRVYTGFGDNHSEIRSFILP